MNEQLPLLTSISTKSEVSNEERSATTNYSQKPFESATGNARQEELVREETLAVKRSKIAVFFSIILAGIGGAVITYYLVKQAEQKKFNQEVCATCLGSLI
jgi:phosphotransferase system  glucose/maltose/N-acetylglucosamine-specific IIC component